MFRDILRGTPLRTLVADALGLLVIAFLFFVFVMVGVAVLP